MNLLLAGGAGYIGSAICGSLLAHGHTPIVVDTLNYGGELMSEDVKLYTGDVADFELIKRVFNENPDIALCMHCAEMASPAISVAEPFDYYYGNVVKSMEFFKHLKELSCKRVIFCSSAAVYADAAGHVVTENSPSGPRNPFGRAKHMTEIILRDFCGAYGIKGIVMRNFNAIGMRDGAPKKAALRPNSIIYNLVRVLRGEAPCFEIAGGDWDTRDGTCIRDYIHCSDMAEANTLAAERFDKIVADSADKKGYTVLNVGSGQGVTVREFVSAFENITGEKIKTQVGEKRPGDSAGVFANIEKTKKLLGWNPELPVEEAILGVLSAIDGM